MKRIIKYLFLKLYNKKHNVTIKSVYASIKAEYAEGVLVDKDCIIDRNVKIGKHSYVNKHSSVENCEIGAFCSISSGVYINPHEHELRNVTTHPIGQKSNNLSITNKKVIIGNDVLISLNSIILDGVTIGDGAVIAAGAVVTEDVKPYEIVGGVPARHIGYRTDKKTIEEMLRIRWWDWPEERINNHICEFQISIPEFAKLMMGNFNNE